MTGGIDLGALGDYGRDLAEDAAAKAKEAGQEFVQERLGGEPQPEPTRPSPGRPLSTAGQRLAKGIQGRRRKAEPTDNTMKWVAGGVAAAALGLLAWARSR